VKVVIFCGGQGLRMREASETMPKPMIPIGSRLKDKQLLESLHESGRAPWELWDPERSSGNVVYAAST
jgi:hypothetical protein